MRVAGLILAAAFAGGICQAASAGAPFHYEQQTRFVIADAILQQPATIDDVIMDLSSSPGFDMFDESASVAIDLPRVFVDTFAVQTSRLTTRAMIAVGVADSTAHGDPRQTEFSGGARSEFIIGFEVMQPLHYRLDAFIYGDMELNGNARVELAGMFDIVQEAGVDVGVSASQAHGAGMLQPGSYNFFASSSVGVFAFDGSYASRADYRARLRLSDAPILRGDLDSDGQVNGADLGLLLQGWIGGCGSDPECLADVDFDGLINGVDLGLVLVNWTR